MGEKFWLIIFIYLKYIFVLPLLVLTHYTTAATTHKTLTISYYEMLHLDETVNRHKKVLV